MRSLYPSGRGRVQERAHPRDRRAGPRSRRAGRGARRVLGRDPPAAGSAARPRSPPVRRRPHGSARADVLAPTAAAPAGDVAFAKRYSTLTLESGRGTGFPLHGTARHRHRPPARHRVAPALPHARPPSHRGAHRPCVVPRAQLTWRSSSRSTPARPACARSRSTPTGAAARVRVPRAPAALPAPGLGRARPRRDLAPRSATRSPRSSRRSDDGETVAAHRHHRTSARPCVVWDRRTGAPRHRAIVWQDRRTAARCDDLRAAGPSSRSCARAPGSCSTPTSPRPSSSGSCARAASRPTTRSRSAPSTRGCCWNLTGVHATEPSNASRTLLYDIDDARVVRRAARPVRRPPLVPARGAPEQRPLRRSPTPTRAAGLTVPV